MYNYRSNVPGHKKLAAGDYFVYYRPGEYVLFGAGIINDIETKEVSTSGEDAALTDYYAYIKTYVEFEPPVRVREIKDQISFLKDRDGLRGVPQNSIYEISREDYTAILHAADEGTLLQNP